ncbi:MAG: DUF4011 domain-containing protein [Bacilli bacterium]|nr:DUF4011 domain-containing protein [Bacilli bacterium]
MSNELENLGFSLRIDSSKSVNYVNYQAESLLKEALGNKQNSFSFLRQIVIKNNTDKDMRDVRLSFKANPEFFEIQSIRITCLEKRKETIVDSFKITLDPLKLYSLNEAMPGSLVATITSEEGEMLATSSADIRFLPIEESASSEWIDEILASFVTPNDPLVKALASEAAEIKKEKYGSSAFDDYQTHDPNAVLEDLDALYLACQARKIRYSTTPASFEKVFQRVRLPREVIEERVGNCLDSSLLFCSLLESVGLRPILIVTNSHALVGCWLEELSFPSTKEDNLQTLLNNASEGFNHLALINAVCFSEGDEVTFDKAMVSAKDFLEKEKKFAFALDIKMCRKEWILPIPTKKEKEDGTVYFDFPSISSSEYTLPNIDVANRRFLPEDAKGNKNRYDYWEDKLLDLNLRNRLINYKGGLRGVEVEVVDPVAYLSFLSNNEKISLVPASLKLSDSAKKQPLSFDEKVYGPTIKENYSKSMVIAVNKSDDPDEALKALARKSNTSIEESGCNPLFLTLGEIRWFDNDKAAERGTGAMYAPIFLLEGKMPRRKNGPFYTLDYDFDNIGLNSTFFQYLKQNYGLDFSRLYPLPHLPNGQVDVRLIYNEIRNIIAPMKNWLLFENRSVLSLFNFSHFVMWSDLKNHRNTVMNNKLVASFVYGEKKWNDAENLIPANEMDERISPRDIATALPADSSQIKAIVDAEEGESFILDGPPGTGKSQTIANMITNFLYHGKKVLFVAEKEVALDVVKRRLDDLHLGQFCLEIASLNKPKSEILSIYSKLLAMGPLENAEDYRSLSDSIMSKRKELNDIIDSLHSKGSYFISPYEAIVGYLDNEQYKTDAKIDKAFISSLTPQKYLESVSAISTYVSFVKPFSSYARSPFIGFQKREYSFDYRDKVFEEIDELVEICKDLELATYNAFFKEGSLYESYKNVEAYLNVMNDLQSEIPSWHEYFLDQQFLDNEEKLRNLATLKVKLAQDKDAVAINFVEGVYTAFDPLELLKEYEEANKLSFFKKIFAMKKLRDRLKPFTHDKNVIKGDSLKKCLELLKEVHFDEENIKNCDSYSRFILSPFDFTSSSESVQRLSEFETTVDIAKNIQKMEFKNDNGENFVSYIHSAARGAIYSDANAKLKKMFEVFGGKKKYLKEYFGFDIEKYPDQHDYFKYLGGKLSDACSSSGRLSEWCNLLAYLDRMEEVVDPAFFSDYISGKIKEENLLASFNADVYLAYLKRVLPERGLTTLSASSTEELVKSYREEMVKIQNLAVNVVAASITEKYPKNADTFASSTNAYKLTKLAKNGGRGASLRYIFDEFKDLVMTLTPCFLMSPVAVAQYLNIEKYHFDVVIFDEASQIPTSEAVGAMARANSVIIAGDEQQMPPTNFFVSSLGIGEDNLASLNSVDEDLESLLDDAISLSFPRERLNWHYRSRHESLIAFSNNRFYGNSLLTFPSPVSEEESVSYKYVNGAYERGRGINKPEAQEVVKDVIRRLKDEKLRHRSIGVVTFNEAQQNLIEDMLEKELAKNEFLDSLPGGEKIFIKNLENVQGDERDVILFSTTYGPDKKSGLSLNFGPLSQKKGERRLNVAVSRAREEMVVFSSIKPEEIQAERAKNMGASYLRDFLYFAKNGLASLANRNQNEMGDEATSIATFLKKDLEELGYSVKENLGASTFKVDLAVSEKNKPNEYVLGIIIDNPKNASLTCRDRHINEPFVLNRLRWNIHHLYSVEYLDHKEEVIKDIVNAFNRSLNGEKLYDDVAIMKDPLFVKKVVDVSPNKKPYVRANCVPEHGSSAMNEGDMFAFFIQTIGTEYPISQELLEARFRETFGLGRIGSVVRSKFTLALNNVKVVIECCGGHNFYYPRSVDMNNNRFWRATEAGDTRRLVDISYIEIGNCAADLLANQGTMSIDDLCHEVNLSLGYALLKKTSYDYVRNAIKWNCSRRNGLYMIGEEQIGIR